MESEETNPEVVEMIATVAPPPLKTRQEMIEDIVAKIMSQEMKLSYSALSNFKSSPRDFIDYKLKVSASTPAMIYGSMVHTLVLQPHLFDQKYLALDDAEICSQIGGAKPRATKKYGEWYDQTVAEANGRIIVESVDYKKAKAVSISVLTNRASKKVLALCPEDRETPIDWDFMNFQWHGITDGSSDKAVFDLKTCADSDPGKFQRDIINMGYYLQAAMYLYGSAFTTNRQQKDYYIIAVDGGGGISVHQLDVHLLDYGMKEYEFLCQKFNQCILEDGFDQSHDFWSKRHDGLFVAERGIKMFQQF